VRARLALYWLALYRRRRMLLALTIGMVAFEALIIVITRTIPPEEMFAGSIRQPPSAFRAFSGSGGAVSLASYPGLLGAGLVHPFWIAMQLTVVGSFGAAAVAADVEAGTIELLMVRPIGATIALGAGSFAINFVAQAWSTVSFLRYLSPFHYYTPADALVSGTVPVGSLTVLLVVFVAGVAVAAWSLERRDLAP
jgi:ABC-2 type transport system permease protein